jgi:hypothetical protein
MENNSAQGIAGGSLLFALGGVGSIKVSGNSFMHLTAAAPALAFATTFATVEVSNNIFHGNSSDAPMLAFAVFNSEVDVTNNIFTDNSSRMGPVFVTATDSGTYNITNNTMSANGGEPSSFEWTSTTDMAVLNFYNNIFFGSASPLVAGSDIYLLDNVGPTGPKVNIFNNNFTNFFSACEADAGCAEAITMSDNLIGEDPLLADPLTGNVNLLPGSPVIGKGAPDAPALPPLDFAGNPLNNPPDMGALAFVPDAGEVDGAGAETEAGPGGCVLAQAAPTAGSFAFLIIPMLLMGLRFRRPQENSDGP